MTFVDCRDEEQKKRFFPVGVLKHMEKKSRHDRWYWDRTYLEAPTGFHNCCSDTIIGMHYVKPLKMNAYEYFIYHVHPFGLNKN